ncbi:unnamed protein product [Arctia plantaginis]|uniref:Uncharacterized protein n=1 Tax=Arctia plantaginis TaxID=874455 RepID=A0A8S1AQB0_ARCPL|nr:unnamed protein product [Arctia plantaginis]CAB3250441.1 unnamed protein product [Arctia plantaginis]
MDVIIYDTISRTRSRRQRLLKGEQPTGSECVSLLRRRIPSRCERENCVRCACTAETKLTEGRQRAAGRYEDPTATFRPPLSCGLPVVTLTREHYGRIRRSTDLRYNDAEMPTN